MSSLIGSQNMHTVLNCTFYRSHTLLIQHFSMSLLKGSQFNKNKKRKQNKQWGFIIYTCLRKGQPSGSHNNTRNTICLMHKGEHTTGGIAAYFYTVETSPHKRVNRKIEKAGGHSVFGSPATQVPENPKAEHPTQHKF